MMHEKDSPEIPDSAISSSSMYEGDPHDYYGPLQARLFKERTVSPTGAGAWIPYYQNHYEYLQIDLGRVTMVSGMVTMGRSYYDQWVSTFIVTYSSGNGWYDVSPVRN